MLIFYCKKYLPFTSETWPHLTQHERPNEQIALRIFVLDPFTKKTQNYFHLPIGPEMWVLSKSGLDRKYFYVITFKFSLKKCRSLISKIIKLKVYFFSVLAEVIIRSSFGHLKSVALEVPPPILISCAWIRTFGTEPRPWNFLSNLSFLEQVVSQDFSKLILRTNQSKNNPHLS